MTQTVQAHARIASVLQIQSKQVAKVDELLTEGNTIPFLARYRLEATGGLDETVLRAVEKHLASHKQLEDRRQTILASLTEQGIADAALRQRVEAADTLAVLEDLYLPFRPKRRTRASTAREQGLGPLAEWLLK